MSELYYKYIQLKSQERYEETKTPYCKQCDKLNPETVLAGKNKNMLVCAECGFPISYRLTKKLVQPKELLDFLETLPRYRKEGDKFIFEDGAIIEPQKSIYAMRGWSRQQEPLWEYYCTKCNKPRTGCIHFISIEEDRRE
jgi:hypothetical protein